jgi:hypothetical protein
LFKNETNNNGATTGDNIYTKTLDLTRVTTGLNTLTSDVLFKVYPNPTSEKLSIVFDVKYASPISISLTSIDGRQTTALFSGEATKGSIEKSFDISQLAKGIYLLNIRTNEGSATQKIMVN